MPVSGRSNPGLDPGFLATKPSPPILQVPLEPAADSPLEMMDVTCWGWSGVARDEGDAASAWLSDFLGRPVRLVRYAGALPV